VAGPGGEVPVSDYAKVLREDADQFVMTAAVVADEMGRPFAVLALEALSDAVARLNELGMLNSPDEDEA
jgi:hypothetical protein